MDEVIFIVGFIYLIIGEMTWLFYLSDEPPLSNTELACAWLLWPKYWIFGR